MTNHARRLLVVTATFCAPVVVPHVVALAASNQPELVEALQPLAYRVGSWTATVEWLDAEGRVIRTTPSLREVRPVMGGRVLEEHGRLFGTPTEILMLVYFDQASTRITEVGIRAPGVFDRLLATVEADNVVFTADPQTVNGQVVTFRAIDSNFQPDRYDTTGWVSQDRGRTWRQTFRQTNFRTGP